MADSAPDAEALQNELLSLNSKHAEVLQAQEEVTRQQSEITKQQSKLARQQAHFKDQQSKIEDELENVQHRRLTVRIELRKYQSDLLSTQGVGEQHQITDARGSFQPDTNRGSYEPQLPVASLHLDVQSRPAVHARQTLPVGLHSVGTDKGGQEDQDRQHTEPQYQATQQTLVHHLSQNGLPTETEQPPLGENAAVQNAADLGERAIAEDQDESPSHSGQHPDTRPLDDSTPGIKTIRGTTYLEKFSHVVRLEDGTWVELACKRCETNLGCHGYLKGLNGLRRHLDLTHGEGLSGGRARLSDEEVLSLGKKRDVSTPEIEALIAGLPEAPPMPKAPAKGSNHIPVDKNINADDSRSVESSNEFSLDEHPIIVQRLDEKYIELRCGWCHKNSYERKKHDVTFWNGISGFGLHLIQSHKQKWEDTVDLEDPELDFTERVLSICYHRVLSSEEVERIRKEGLKALKVDYFKTSKTKRKRRAKMRESPETDSQDGDYRPGSSNQAHNSTIREKRLRKSSPERMSPKLPNQSSPAPSMIVSSLEEELRKTSNESLKPVLFSEFCPCNVTGHECQVFRGCSKKKLCLEGPHDTFCLRNDTLTHDIRPTCTSTSFL